MMSLPPDPSVVTGDHMYSIQAYLYLLSWFSLRSDFVKKNYFGNAWKITFLALVFQHTSVDGYGDTPAPPTKSSSRQSLPRCRNSVASITDEQPHVGNYRLLKTIGKGNFAKVKLARHVLTGREVRDFWYVSDYMFGVQSHYFSLFFYWLYYFINLSWTTRWYRP